MFFWLQILSHRFFFSFIFWATVFFLFVWFFFFMNVFCLLVVADIWFWTSQMASFSVDSSFHCPNWRHIWVIFQNDSCACVRKKTLQITHTHKRFTHNVYKCHTSASVILCFLVFLRYHYEYIWVFYVLQALGSWVLFAWNCGWENWCICIWGVSFRTHLWEETCAWIKPEFTQLGMYLITILWSYLQDKEATLTICYG